MAVEAHGSRFSRRSVRAAVSDRQGLRQNGHNPAPFAHAQIESLRAAVSGPQCPGISSRTRLDRFRDHCGDRLGELSPPRVCGRNSCKEFRDHSVIVSGLAFHHESHSPTRITNENSGNRPDLIRASSVSEVHRWLLIEAPESGRKAAQAACFRSVRERMRERWSGSEGTTSMRLGRPSPMRTSTSPPHAAATP